MGRHEKSRGRRLLGRTRDSMGAKERGLLVREAMREAVQAENWGKSAIAELLRAVQKHGVWRAWGYRSFVEFVRKECSLSGRKAQRRMQIFERWVSDGGLSPDKLAELPWSKVALVTRFVDRSNAHEMARMVESLSYRELRRKLPTMGAAGKATRGSTSLAAIRPGNGPARNGCGAAKTPPVSRAGRAEAGGPADPSPGPAGTQAQGLALPAVVGHAGSDRAVSMRDWLSRRPPEDQFFVSEADWQQLGYAALHGKSCLITGPSGCGKSELCDLAAEAAGRPLVSFNCGAMSEPRSTLIGNTHFDREKGTFFCESRFVRAVRQPYTGIKLDEISRLKPEGFNILLPLLDYQGYLALDEREDGAVVHKAEGLFFLATANLGQEYTGADALDKALKDRFDEVIDLSFPPKPNEQAILTRRCPGLTDSDAKRLVKMAARQREMAAEGEFVEQVSTRALLNAARQIAYGLPFERAVAYCILNHFSSEGREVSERAKLEQIVQKEGE
jgi:MoxR-like ATPase